MLPTTVILIGSRNPSLMTDRAPAHAEDDVSTRQAFSSAALSPKQIVSSYSAEQWEEFIEEWTAGLKLEYFEVQRFSGAGDKGRDVVGFVSNPVTTSQWDNYQCKRYTNRPLRPSDIWIELGKACYYTFIGDYTLPRKYRFVAPHDVGPTLRELLLKPGELQTALLTNWSSNCENAITEEKAVPLSAELRQHILAIDFSIFGYAPLRAVVEQHMKSPYWATRFQRAVPNRPPVEEPPTTPARHETKYIRHLLDAYGEAENRSIDAISDLEATPRFSSHLKRSRQWFFHAEALNRFSRDHYPPGAFDGLKNQILDGVIDVCERNYAHGYERVCTVTDRAADLPLGNSSLAPLAAIADKKGMCHHLANEDKLHWRRT
jgi:hypothetical protein